MVAAKLRGDGDVVDHGDTEIPARQPPADKARTARSAAYPAQARCGSPPPPPALAVGPARTIAGSVGTTCMSRKPTARTPTSTGTASNTRRTTKRRMFSRPDRTPHARRATPCPPGCATASPVVRKICPATARMSGRNSYPIPKNSMVWNNWHKQAIPKPLIKQYEGHHRQTIPSRAAFPDFRNRCRRACSPDQSGEPGYSGL